MNDQGRSNATQVDRLIAQLRDRGVAGIDQYERRLRDNSANPVVLDDLVFEGLAALMFREQHWQVTLRERPDLQLRLGEHIVYAEVKHFHEKAQDRLDEQAMLQATDELVLIGDLTATEGLPPWKQIANVAKRKAAVYVDHVPNILIIESSSESLELMLASAVNEYDDEVRRSFDPRLRRLNGIMLVSTGSIRISGGPRNVEFCPTRHAAVPLNDRLASALETIRFG